MYLRHKHAVSNAMKKIERDAGVVLHTKKSAAASMVGRHLVRGGMKAERAQMHSCKDDILGRGVAAHSFLFFEPSESRSVWTDLKRARASCWKSQKRAGPPWRSPGFYAANEWFWEPSGVRGMTPFVGVCVTTAQGRQWSWKSEDRLRTTEQNWMPIQ